MTDHPQCTGEYSLANGTRWHWSVEYFDDADDGGLTGYRVAVHFEHGEMQMHGAVHLPSDDPDPMKISGHDNRDKSTLHESNTFDFDLPFFVPYRVACAKGWRWSTPCISPQRFFQR